MKSYFKLLVVILGATQLLAACAVPDGGISSIANQNPLQEQSSDRQEKNTDRAMERPSSTISSSGVNDRYTSGRPMYGCVIEKTMFQGDFRAFEEALAAGEDPRRCPNYPKGIFNNLNWVCRDNPLSAHQFFVKLEKRGIFKDSPQWLLHTSSLYKCVEGVKVALRYGANPNEAAQKAEKEPLILTLLDGEVRAEESIEITSLLIDAGANPWNTDKSGNTIFSLLEKQYTTYPIYSTSWPRVKAILLKAHQANE